MTGKSHRPTDSKKSQKGHTELELWAASAVLLLAAWLRLAAFDETLITPDQSAILDVAFQVTHGGYFPLTGMKSSVGVMQTPLVPLLAAFPLLLVRRVIAVQWFFSALDLLAVALLFRTVRRAFGLRAALVSTLLYATSPWVILYVRTIWYQSLLPTLATYAFCALLALSTPGRSRPWLIPLSLLAMTMLGMAHLAAAPWSIFLWLLVAFVGLRQKEWRPVLIGALVSLLTALPYIAYLAMTGFNDLTIMLHAGSQASTFNTTSFRLARELVTGALVVANAHGDQWDRAIIEWSAAYHLVLWTWGAAVIWASIAVLRRHRRHTSLALILGWSLAIPILFLRSGIHLQHFYLLPLFPAPYVLIGVAIAQLAQINDSGDAWLRRILAALPLGLLILVALWWSHLWFVRIQLEAQGELQRPTRGWLMDQAAVTTQHYLAENPDGQVVILAHYVGEMSPFDWIRGYTRSPRVRIVPVDRGFLIPASPTCYILGPQVSTDALSPVADWVSERPDMTIPANPPWSVFCQDGAPPQPEPRAQWENNLALLETNLSGEFVPEGTLHLQLSWLYQGPSRTVYHFFHHLLLDDKLVAQIDGTSVPQWYWREGDTLITRFDLPLPETLQPGVYRVRVGLYTYPELTRILVVDGSDGVTIAEFTYPPEG